MSTLLKALAAAIVLLLVVLALNAARQGSRQLAVTPQPGVALDAQASAARLGQAVRLPTLAAADGHTDPAFEALHALLQTHYPLVHRALRRETFGRHALLYTWEGSDPALAPIALMGHQDVVPVAPGSEPLWTVPPFSGAVQDGYIWGRGAWDSKSNVMGLMEAVEALLRSGFQPRRTVYLVFGADEEIGGTDGAQRIARALAERLRPRGQRLAFVLDEGLVITQGIVPGVSEPVALIGVAEKGYVTVRVKARAAGGHTSMPPPRSAIGQVSEAVERIERQQMPAQLQGAARELFETLAPHMHGIGRLMLANLWLTRPLVEAQLVKSPSTNAVLRSTAVATVFQAGDRENVLPQQAQASINFRLLPGDTAARAVEHARRAAGDAVTVEPAGEVTEPSRVSSTGSWGYRAIARSLRELQPEVLVAPGLLTGGTDARHFAGLADDIYRFSPVRVGPSDLARIHGTNERLSVQNYVQIIQFYERLIRLAQDGDADQSARSKP